MMRLVLTGWHQLTREKMHEAMLYSIVVLWYGVLRNKYIWNRNMERNWERYSGYGIRQLMWWWESRRCRRYITF